MFKDRNSF